MSGQMQDDWRTPEKRQMVVAKIAEAVQQYPDVLNRNPSEIEEAIFGKVNDKDQYMNMVGKVLLSIKHKGHQLMNSRGVANSGGHVGGGMMGYQPGMHPDPGYMHNGMHMRGPHPGMTMGAPAGMGGHHPHMMSNPHMMNNQRMNMMAAHGGQMMPTMGGPPHHPMMGMGPRMHHNMIYTGGRMPMGGGMVHRMSGGGGGMNTAQPPSDGVLSVTALPNPSFNTVGGSGNLMEQQMQQHSMNPNFTNVSPQQQQQQQQQLQEQQLRQQQQQQHQQSMHPPGVNPQQPTGPPINTQVPSPAPKPVLAPSPRSHPMPSPNTPWNPNSPARAQSPSQMQSHPEANAAVLSKLQELQPYVPLLARMMDKIEKGYQGDKTKNEQWVKLNSLYNVIQSKNIKIPLQTLEKCHAALDSLFKKDPNASAPSPASIQPGSVPVPSPAMSVTQGKISNPPSTKVVSPKPPSSVSPPIMSPSRNLHDFISLASPHPLSSALKPTFCPEEDPLDRLPPEKKAKLDKQASRSFILGLKREILRLRNFYVKQVQEDGGPSSIDGSILLECKLVSQGLPNVPPLMIRVARDYPYTSPECLIPEYQCDSSFEFTKRVGQVLMNRLSGCEFKYGISHVLNSWESSVLEILSQELEDVSD